jgi:hypothetical protein
MTTPTKTIHAAFEAGEGILRLAPTWVPRSFCIPGRRIKLDPRDYYSFGAVRGGIDERWFSSTTKADNGPLTTPDEGLSYVVYEAGGAVYKVLLIARSRRAGCGVARRRPLEPVRQVADLLQIF